MKSWGREAPFASFSPPVFRAGIFLLAVFFRATHDGQHERGTTFSPNICVYCDYLRQEFNLRQHSYWEHPFVKHGVHESFDVGGDGGVRLTSVGVVRAPTQVGVVDNVVSLDKTLCSKPRTIKWVVMRETFHRPVSRKRGWRVGIGVPILLSSLS